MRVTEENAEDEQSGYPVVTHPIRNGRYAVKDKYLADFPESADIETSSADYAGRFSGAIGTYLLSVQCRIILDMLTDCQGGRLLSIGGGHGQLVEPLVHRGFEVTVTGSHDICRERLMRRIQDVPCSYRTCNSIDLPFADGEYDVVMAIRLLTHVSRWQRLIAEMCRVSNKIVIFDYPDRRSSNILYCLLFPVKKALEGNTRPFMMFSRAQLTKELAKNGYGGTVFQPQFFFPMVFHRKLSNPHLSNILETGARLIGLTNLLGSPIILKSRKMKISANGEAGLLPTSIAKHISGRAV